MKYFFPASSGLKYGMCIIHSKNMVYNSCWYLHSALEFEKWLPYIILFDPHPCPLQMENERMF